jgi:hypothetical protein
MSIVIFKLNNDKIDMINETKPPINRTSGLMKKDTVKYNIGIVISIMK